MVCPNQKERSIRLAADCHGLLNTGKGKCPLFFCFTSPHLTSSSAPPPPTSWRTHSPLRILTAPFPPPLSTLHVRASFVRKHQTWNITRGPLHCSCSVGVSANYLFTVRMLHSTPKTGKEVPLENRCVAADCREVGLALQVKNKRTKMRERTSGR
jgi:hypothetical protein